MLTQPARGAGQMAGPISVAALYRFAPFDDHVQLRGPLVEICSKQDLRGTLLLAAEGINGTIAGSPEQVACVLDHIRALPGCAELDVKMSSAPVMPFKRMKVRLKAEIVTMGVEGVDPLASAGTYVEPGEWNALISDPDTIVIDTRNEYEVAIGSFADAIDPKTRSFREFPAWFRQARGELLARGKTPRIAMYCTGGIRCEKSTAFLKQEGVEDVYHLKGGILAYLEQVPEAFSLWRGECYVFDERVAIGHGLAPGTHVMCPDCGRAVSGTAVAAASADIVRACPVCGPAGAQPSSGAAG